MYRLDLYSFYFVVYLKHNSYSLPTDVIYSAEIVYCSGPSKNMNLY
jgi:hypothetical protein